MPTSANDCVILVDLVYSIIMRWQFQLCIIIIFSRIEYIRPSQIVKVDSFDWAKRPLTSTGFAPFQFRCLMSDKEFCVILAEVFPSTYIEYYNKNHVHAGTADLSVGACWNCLGGLTFLSGIVHPYHQLITQSWLPASLTFVRYFCWQRKSCSGRDALSFYGHYVSR